MSLRAGDWVEVRSREEILSTLDRNGRLENLPFMPQMLQYCGKRFRVYKRAHKTCDTINFAGGRKLPGGIHLENLRCDGAAFGGCQAACLIFWKEAWLKPADQPDDAAVMPAATGCTEADLVAGTLAADQPSVGGPRYSCQATEVLEATTRLPWWDVRQYAEDLTSGNASAWRLLTGSIYAALFTLYCYLPSFGLGGQAKRFTRAYDAAQRLYGGIPFPRYRGTIPADQPAPSATLDLQPGELVRVKSYEDILSTIDVNNRNRGLSFDAEMVPYCGRTFRVRSRVTTFVNEKTGLINRLRGPAVILDNVWCNSRYSDCRMQCPRAIFPWWREIWLERVTGDTSNTASQARADREETRTPVASAS
jgi:hypothetical protein